MTGFLRWEMRIEMETRLVSRRPWAVSGWGAVLNWLGPARCAAGAAGLERDRAKQKNESPGRERGRGQGRVASPFPIPGSQPSQATVFILPFRILYFSTKIS